MAAKPKLGQNFLRDHQAVERIVAALGDLSNHTVVEIGPGKGVITERLAARAKHIIAIELDRELAWDLEQRFSPEKGITNVTVLRQDILRFDFARAAHDSSNNASKGAGNDVSNNAGQDAGRGAGQRVIVVGNLPYYITSPILLHLAASAASLDRAVLMVQREVADRVTAHPSTREYGVLTATLALYGPTEALFTLPPSSFVPPPQVHSTVFRWRFAPRFTELSLNEAEFIPFLRQCFALKRKTLSNNLRAAGFEPPQIAAALSEAEIDPLARTETLPLEQLAALWRTLKNSPA